MEKKLYRIMLLACDCLSFFLTAVLFVLIYYSSESLGFQENIYIKDNFKVW